MQVIAPPFQTNHCEPRLADNTGFSQAADRAAMKAVLGQTRWLLPAHDDGFTVEYGRVVGRLSSPKTPGPVEVLQ